MHFLYCDVLISCVNARLKCKIEKAFKCMIRYCFNLKGRESTKNFTNSIFGCKLLDYFDYRFSLIVFKIIKYQQPQYLYDKLIFSQSDRTCNLNIPRFSNVQKNRFVVRSAQLWNSLPNQVKRESNFDKFRTLSFEYFSNRKPV